MYLGIGYIRDENATIRAPIQVGDAVLIRVITLMSRTTCRLRYCCMSLI